MLNPVGPEPRVVYQRRRVAVVAAAVLALFAVVWLVSASGGSGPDPQAVQAAATGSMTASAPAPSSSAATQTPSTPPTSASPGTTAAVSPSAMPVAAAPSTVVCSDSVIDIAAQVAAPSYTVGAQPVFRLLITNTGQSACAAEVSANLQRVLVYSADGSRRIWSNNDCSPSDATAMRTLQPGEQAVYSVQWSGTTSAAACTGARQPVGAGQYIVLVALGARQSTPVPFTIA